MEKEIEELRAYCRRIDELVKKKGAKTEYCEARYKAAQMYLEHGYKDLAFHQTLLAKNELHQIVKRSTRSISPDGKGFDLFELDDYCKEHDAETTENRLFWDLLYLESQDLFDSFMLYLERDRQPQSRYYYPRRDCLRKTGIVQGMQDLEDDVLDILSISMPPGTGKGQPLYSKVLTPDGYVEMRDIKVGSKVITPEKGKNYGTKVETVLGVFPHKDMDVYELSLSPREGSPRRFKCRCDISHIWRVSFDKPRTKDRHLCYKGGYGDYEDVEMDKLIQEFESGRKIYIPMQDYQCFPFELVDIKYVGKEDTQCIYISGEDHLYITDAGIITHNTTLEKFFCAWVMGKHPQDYNLFFSHSSEITRMFFDGVKDIITNDTEYRYKEIFPKVFVQSTNAKAETLNLNDYKPFASLQCTSVGAKNSGKVRASRYLFCDDLIGGIEEALNKALLDKLWRVYGTDARQRKLNGKVKEIHIATRWSVHDVIGRLQLIYKGNDRARFIAVPDIDPKTGESNFLYKYNGMTVEFFHDQEMTMDDITYRCLYKNDPIEREGILYHDDELRRYVSLPLREPDAIYAIADTKNKGTDFMVVPVLLKYDDDYYCVDCICDDTCDFGVQTERTANLLYRNKVQQAEFESNNGGERVAADVDKALKLMGGFTNITTKPTETNKETRIIVNADWVKKHILFKDPTLYTAKEDYGVMMAWLCRYSIVGKNEHDDVPDCFANAALYFTKGTQKGTVCAAFNPFRSNYQSAYTGYYS